MIIHIDEVLSVRSFSVELINRISSEQRLSRRNSSQTTFPIRNLQTSESIELTVIPISDL